MGSGQGFFLNANGFRQLLGKKTQHLILKVCLILLTLPATVNMFATSFALIGARLLSFLSCRAYGKQGMTAVT